MRKFLIINPFGIGDVLFTTPIIKNLKANIPNAFIGYVANARTAPVLEQSLDIDKVYVYERDEFHAIYKKSKPQFLKSLSKLLNSIKSVQFDVVIDLSSNSSASFLMMAIRIPLRIGYNFKNRSPYLTKKIPLNGGYEGRHVAEYYLDLVKELGLDIHTNTFEMPLSDQDRQWADDFLRQNLQGGDTRIGLVPGGGASWGKDALYKRWSAENYAKLADKMIENYQAQIILLGDQNEKSLCRKVAELMQHKAVIASGQTTITQCSALMQRCSLVVCNDGGPLHMAVAVGTKTVSIFGPVDDTVYGPYPRNQHRVVKKSIACRPCYRQFRRAHCEHISCLRQITLEDVLNQVEQSLKVSVNP